MIYLVQLRSNMEQEPKFKLDIRLTVGKIGYTVTLLKGDSDIYISFLIEDLGDAILSGALDRMIKEAKSKILTKYETTKND